MTTTDQKTILDSYLKLQNGSDIRGVALDGVPGEKVNLDIGTAHYIGRAFARWLRNKNCGHDTKGNIQLTVSVGCDPRISGTSLGDSFCEGLIAEGVNIYLCGIASTPAMFMSTLFDSFNCDGAVMITASHLPFNRNGFKFFDKDGGLDKGDIKEILTAAAAIEAGTDTDPYPVFEEGMLMEGDLMDRYCKHLCELICDGVGIAGYVSDDSNKCECASNPAKRSLPLEGLRIVVDAGNGSGGFYANKVLRPLGAEVIGCYLEPDGNFPNHIPNPENKEAMDSICSAVKEHGADLGIIFDTDVDRSAAVDENGHEIARNGIVALAAALVSEKHPGTTVVTDSITSDQLAVFLEKDLGMKHLRFKRGYKNVINKAIELNEAGEECYLAIETSGHAAIRDNHFLDDGAYLATLIVIKTAKLAAEGKKISSMLAGLEEPADATEVRMKLSGDDFAAVGDRILRELEDWIRSGSAGLKGSDMGSSTKTNDGSGIAEGTFGFELVEPNYEGVRANYCGGSCGTGSDDFQIGSEGTFFDGSEGTVTGWFLLRKSLHDPIMPLNIESNQPGGCKIIAERLKAFLCRYEELDTSGL